MNTPVNFELAKLLKEKGYSWECENFYKKGKYDKKFYLTTGTEYESDRDCIWDWNLNGGKSGMLSKVIPYPNESTAIYYSAPTIAEVVMWLYEKHGIWIAVNRVVIGSDEWDYGYIISYLPKEYEFEKRRSKHLVEIQSFKEGVGSYHGAWHTPTEAYEVAIEYTLKNLI